MPPTTLNSEEPVELTCSGQRAAQQSFDELSVLLEYGGGPSWSL